MAMPSMRPRRSAASSTEKNSIGAIRVQQDVTYVQLADDVAPKFGNSLVLEAGLEMTRLVGEPDMQRPDRPARRSPSPNSPCAGLAALLAESRKD
mgnify:CR=1 FL=1